MKQTPKDFVAKYYPFAYQTQCKTGIDARFILAQAALETGWGQSAPGNMFFGIKASAGTPPDKRQLVATTEILSRSDAVFPQIISITPLASGKYKYVVKDWFCKYDSPEESFTHHARFFFDNKRYASALKVKEDPFSFAQAIAQAGYATAPDYAATLKKIIKTIEQYIP